MPLLTQKGTEAGRAELPAYCRGIPNPAQRPLLFAARVPQFRKRMLLAKTLIQRHLEGTKRRHLLSEMVLVLADAAVPSSDCLVFTHHDVLGNLVEQSVIY
jgi:hypothetical protein